MFTKQHFKALARLLKETDATSKTELIHELAKLFQADNPRFNRSKFYMACGILIQDSA